MNKKINPKFIALTFGILVLLFATGYYLIMAWSEPTAVPPGANVPAPINVGTTTQHKAGEIGATLFRDRDNTAWFVDPAGNSVFAGNVGVGTNNPTTGRLVVSGGSLDMTTNRITNVATPIASTDVATRGFVEAAVGGGPIALGSLHQYGFDSACNWVINGAFRWTEGGGALPSCMTGGAIGCMINRSTACTQHVHANTRVGTTGSFVDCIGRRWWNFTLFQSGFSSHTFDCWSVI